MQLHESHARLVRRSSPGTARKVSNRAFAGGALPGSLAAP
jgi:hypothetical protein